MNTSSITAWLHILTNGKKIVSDSVLTEKFDKELTGCTRLRVDLTPVSGKWDKKKTQVYAIDPFSQTNYGKFYYTP